MFKKETNAADYDLAVLQMIQQAIITTLFLIAATYMGWRFWKTFHRRNDAGCAKGCGCASDKVSTLKTPQGSSHIQSGL